MTCVPTSAASPLTAVTVSASPSGSLSAPPPLSANTFAAPLRTVSSSVLNESSTATGGSFTPSMVIVTVAVSVSPSGSEIV